MNNKSFWSFLPWNKFETPEFTAIENLPILFGYPTARLNDDIEGFYLPEEIHEIIIACDQNEIKVNPNVSFLYSEGRNECMIHIKNGKESRIVFRSKPKFNEIVFPQHIGMRRFLLNCIGESHCRLIELGLTKEQSDMKFYDSFIAKQNKRSDE